MADLIVNLIDKYTVVTLIALGFATAGLVLLTLIKTRSAPHVLGMAALGIGAMVLVANITTFANRAGEDVLGNETITVEQATGRSGPGQSSGSPGGSTGTTCTPDQRESNSC
ncbi:MAG: hypothetical protein F4X04_01480 [Holophagales bacterium]|nr:hypothetical protein [Holophagales bacterium]